MSQTIHAGPKIGWYSTDWSKKDLPDGQALMTHGGTFYYRMAMPAEELNRHGYTCLISWAMEPAPDGHLRVMDIHGEWHDDCDAVVFQRWMHKDSPTLARRAQACGQRVINDVDDHFWALPRTNIAHKTTDPKNNPDFNRDHYRQMLKVSDAVICSTETIARFVERQGAPVHICRNSIDIHRWKQHDTSELHFGWTGGIPWRANDLTLLRGIIGPFLEDHGLDFYHGGESNDPNYPKAPEQLGIDTSRVPYSSVPIVPIGEYPNIWDPITAMVIPLERCEFNDAKSWLKALEASACGIPYIASDLPEQRFFVEDGGMGRLARKPWQWMDHLEDLLDPIVRKREGEANRAHAEEWDIGRRWQQWDQVFRALIPSRPLAAAA